MAQADTIVPGTGNGNAGSMSQVASQMYTALTVGYYESPVLAKLNRDNQIIQMYGGLLNMSEDDKQKTNIVDVPLNTQAFDRYSYTNNNPLRSIDPTGHVTCDKGKCSGGNSDFGYEYDDFTGKGKIWYFGKVYELDNWDAHGSWGAHDKNVDDFMAAADAYASAVEQIPLLQEQVSITNVGIGIGLIVAGIGVIGCTGLVGCGVAALGFGAAGVSAWYNHQAKELLKIQEDQRSSALITGATLFQILSGDIYLPIINNESTP